MIFIFDDNKEPEDIFAETSDKAGATTPPNLPVPGAPQPASGGVVPQNPSKGSTPLPVGESGVIMEKSAFGKKLVFIGVIVGVILIGLGVWYFLFYNTGASVQVNPDDFADTSDALLPPDTNTTEPPIDSEPVINEDDLSTPPDETTPDETVIEDSDSDGLTNAEERALGTDPNNPDTDGDGLSDREEVRTYETDPNNSDSDGDGFDDGSEVQNGFDPNGPGRLLQLPQ